MEYSRKWEYVTETTYRLKVPQGWLVRSTMSGRGCGDCSNYAVSTTMVFLSDINNEWILKKEE